MSTLTGSSTADIKAPIERVWELVEDVEAAPQWQGGMNSMRAIQRDDQGRATLCEVGADAKVRTIKTIVRFDYDEAPRRLSWRQEKGDVKSLQGSWELEELGQDGTRATYRIEVDPGRVLGMMVRGPVEAAVRQMLAGARAGELKARIEGSERSD